MTDENATPAPETTETPVTTESDGVALHITAHPEVSGSASNTAASLDIDDAALETKEIEDGRTEEQAAADAETVAARKATNLANGLDEDGNSLEVDENGQHPDSAGPKDGKAYDHQA